MPELPGIVAMRTDKLVTYLFDGQPHPLAEPMSTWLGDSRRFSDFVTTFRDKIRKKLRVTQDPETLSDLRLELETAYRLLGERSLNVAYEPQQSAPGRSPDFAVTYTTSLTFMVEVTRVRTAIKDIPPHTNNDPQLESERLTDAISSKLGQLLAQRANVLIVSMNVLQTTQSDLQSAMLRVQQRAEGNDAAYWQRYGFQDRSDFFRQFQRLSEVLVRRPRLRADEPMVIWVNPQAKHPLPGRVRTALYRSHNLKS